MKPGNIFILLPLLIMIASCGDNSAEKRETARKDIERMRWIIGSWKNVDGDYVSYETWKMQDEKLFSGTGITVFKEDTVFKESITLQQNGNELYYMAKVNGQNRSETVPFKFIGVFDGAFTFENKEHDYPSLIVYKNPQPDMLCARISGKKDGKNQYTDFIFVRIK